MNIGLVAHDSKKADAEFLHCVQRRFKQAFSLCHGNYRKADRGGYESECV